MLLWFGPISVLLCLSSFLRSSPNFPILLAPRGKVGSDWDTQSRHLVPLLLSSGSFTFSLQMCSCSCLSRCRRLAPGQQVAPLHPEVSERWICCDHQWQEGLLGPLRSVVRMCISVDLAPPVVGGTPKPPAFPPPCHCCHILLDAAGSCMAFLSHIFVKRVFTCQTIFVLFSKERIRD